MKPLNKKFPPSKTSETACLPSFIMDRKVFSHQDTDKKQ
ncbi:hypothetical protein B4168_3019 [Anoxybacillus flavithermus]|nr:hypothetical protein B4168_3019 [Anoxybacillus flavithermus]OAO86308.1 hypothetical protein GT23_2201 [Parageobacillus thermoglucosidasius]